MKSVTCSAPVNIAVIKYWGKRDTELILPTNSSLSVTLSQDILHSKTSVAASDKFEQDRLWLNGKEEDITKNKRMHNCFRETRQLRAEMEAKAKAQGKELEPISTYKVHVCSENNFPTAAGLASSASGLAALAYTLAQLYELDEVSTSDLSRIARQGSGSACRSLFGGFVSWEMGEKEDGSDSYAVQVAPETHWPELEALICVVSDKKKGTSSTAGMQSTIKTSPLMAERIKVVPERMEGMKKAILEKDFQSFAELTMRDSNQFHAVCLDTFPPIFYLNDTSRAIIQLITEYNRSAGEYKAAYTYDAGPNAVIYAPKENMKEIIQLIGHYFPTNKESKEFFADVYNVQPNFDDFVPKDHKEAFNENVIPVQPAGSVSRLLHTKVDDGPRVWKEADSLLNEQGLPKRTV